MCWLVTNISTLGIARSRETIHGAGMAQIAIHVNLQLAVVLLLYWVLQPPGLSPRPGPRVRVRDQAPGSGSETRPQSLSPRPGPQV